jgi:hypothetical protein
MHIHRTAEVILWAFLSAALAYALGSCGKSDARDDTERAYKLANHYRWQRDSTLVAQRKTDTITQVVVRQDARLSAELDSLRRVTAYADSVLKDSTATIPELRMALAVTIARSQTFQAQTLAYRDSVRTLIAAHAEERFAMNKTLAYADSTITASRTALQAERKKRWHYRTQGAFVGGILALLAVIAL